MMSQQEAKPMLVGPFLQGGLAEATVPPSVIAAVCASEGDEDSAPRIWLSAPVEVAP